jgi:hypothetical protein
MEFIQRIVTIKPLYNATQVNYQPVRYPLGRVHKAIRRKKMMLLNGANVSMPSAGIQRKPNQNLCRGTRKNQKERREDFNFLFNKTKCARSHEINLIIQERDINSVLFHTVLKPRAYVISFLLREKSGICREGEFDMTLIKTKFNIRENSYIKDILSSLKKKTIIRKTVCRAQGKSLSSEIHV